MVVRICDRLCLFAFTSLTISIDLSYHQSHLAFSNLAKPLFPFVVCLLGLVAMTTSTNACVLAESHHLLKLRRRWMK